MKWEKLSVIVSNQSSEAVSNILENLNHNGIQTKNINQRIELISYFKISDKINLKKLKISINNLKQFGLNPGHFNIKTRIVDDNRWGITWEKDYDITKITRFLTIVPSWKKYYAKMPGEIILKLDPKRAFGTGIHPTTQLTLQALETVIRGNEHIIDVGTGSGILAIAAVKMGAKDANGYDVTNDSIISAKRNVKLNHVSDKVFIRPNDLLDHINDQADLIVANMLPKFIFQLIPQAFDCLKSNGYFVISGIIDTSLDEILRALKDNHFKIHQILLMNDWRGIIAKK